MANTGIVCSATTPRVITVIEEMNTFLIDDFIIYALSAQ
jgi:hypothetical protein